MCTHYSQYHTWVVVLVGPTCMYVPGLQSRSNLGHSANFLTTMMQTASLQSKGQKQVGPGNGVEVLENKENVQETAPVGLQEGAGGQSFTLLCFPKGMHSHPRVRDNYTAASQ